MLAYSLVGESVKFMILGMTIVFLFLYLLVQIMRLQAYLIEKYFPGESMPLPSSSEHEEEEKARVAAIIAAVMEYRKTDSGTKG